MMHVSFTKNANVREEQQHGQKFEQFIWTQFKRPVDRRFTGLPLILLHKTMVRRQSP
jgi:hypothetical protein